MDREIKQFRQNAASEKLSQTLKNLPEGLLVPDSKQSQSPDLSDIPLSIGSPAVNYLEPEFISNYSTQLPGTQVEQSVDQKVKSDNYRNLYDTCTKQVFLSSFH